MTIVKKMSHEEIRQQHETISAIDSKVSGIDDKVTEFTKTAVKVGKIWVPVFGAICAAIGSIITITITGYKWQDSLVKKPQFEHAVSALMRQDSIQTAKIDTLNKNKVNYADIKKSKGQWAFVTTYRDKNGKTHVND